MLTLPETSWKASPLPVARKSATELLHAIFRLQLKIQHRKGKHWAWIACSSCMHSRMTTVS